MTRSDGYILVLWGAQFDEAPATIFITAFRTAGWRVKVVGLHGQHITGAYGVTLTPDIYLDEALRLAPLTTCLIIPTTLRMLDPFTHDPRLTRFLADVCACGARIVVGGISADDDHGLLPSETVEIYPLGEDVFEYARRIALEA